MSTQSSTGLQPDRTCDNECQCEYSGHPGEYSQHHVSTQSPTGPDLRQRVPVRADAGVDAQDCVGDDGGEGKDVEHVVHRCNERAQSSVDTVGDAANAAMQ